MAPGAVALESMVVMPPDLLVLAQGMPTSIRTVVADNLRHPALAGVHGAHRRMELPMPLWLCGRPHVAEAVELLAAARDRLPDGANEP